MIKRIWHGYTTPERADDYEALLKAEVITGIEGKNIPGFRGIDVLRRIKADEERRSIPVVMLTSSSEERDIVESYALGVNSYLIKPIEFSKLGEQVVNAGLYWLLANKVPS